MKKIIKGTRRQKVIGAARIFTDVMRLLSRHAELSIPFMAAAFCDGILLVWLFLAAQPSAAIIVGRGGSMPPLAMVPDVFVWAREVLGVILGLFLISVGIVAAYRTRLGYPSDWRFAVRKATARYRSVLAAWLLVRGATAVVLRLIWVVTGVNAGMPGTMVVNAALAVLLQMPFMYVLPVILVENRRLVPALRRSVAIMGRYPVVTAFVSILAALILLPTAIIYQQIVQHIIAGGAFTGYMTSIAHISSVWCSLLWLSVSGTMLLYRHKQDEKYSVLPVMKEPELVMAANEGR